MMKWKVTRAPRCASADRSSDYQRKVAELSDRTTHLQPSNFSHGGDKKNVVPLLENRKQAQQTSELSRKPSFAATDCINLKGIFGISKDRNDSSTYTSLTVINGDRQRSRSEIRGRSIDRLMVGYHAAPLIGPRHAQQNETSASKNVRSSSPGEKTGCSWVRGRRRERESRKTLQNGNVQEGRTVIAESKCSPSKKLSNGRTTLDSSEPVSKYHKLRESISLPQQNTVDGKENKEINNNNESHNREEVGSPPFNAEVTKPPPKLRKNRKKRMAPKPMIRPSLFEDSNSGIKLKLDKISEDMVPGGDTSSTQEQAKTNHERIEYNCELGAENIPKETVTSCESDQKRRESRVSFLLVNAEVHAQANTQAEKFHEDIDEKSVHVQNTYPRKEERIENDANTQNMEKCNHHAKVKFVESTDPVKDSPIIDDPDYTPPNSSDEAEKTVESVVNLIDHCSVSEVQLTNGDHVGVPKPPEFVEEEETGSFQSKCSISEEEAPKNESRTATSEKLVHHPEQDTNFSLVTNDREFNKCDINKANFEVEEEEELPEIADSICGDVEDNEFSRASPSTQSSDLSCGMFPNIRSDNSPPSPPRKKMASPQNMTINVVVRNSKEPPSPTTKETPAGSIVKKSFVLTVAKQEEGFRSLCANRDPSSGYPDAEVTKDQQISVTFLCSDIAVAVVEESLPNNARLRSVSVPPNATTTDALLCSPLQRSYSKDRRQKEKQNSRRKSHKGRKKDSLFHMPQAVIDELSQVLEHRKRVPDEKVPSM